MWHGLWDKRSDHKVPSKPQSLNDKNVLVGLLWKCVCWKHLQLIHRKWTKETNLTRETIYKNLINITKNWDGSIYDPNLMGKKIQKQGKHYNPKDNEYKKSFDVSWVEININIWNFHSYNLKATVFY